MSNNIKLYINPLTANNIKVLLLCNALDIKPDFQEIALNKGEHQQAEFLKINPEGLLPVLQQEDFVLTESHAIMQYLAANELSALWPRDIKQQAQVLKILFWHSNYFFAAVSPITQRKVVFPHWGFGEKAVSEQNWQAYHQALSTLDGYLAQSTFLASDELTIADISTVAFFVFREQAGMPLDNYRNVQRWLNDLAQRPWYKATHAHLMKCLAG